MESVDEAKGLDPVPAAAFAEGQEGYWYGCDIFVRTLKNTRWVSKPWSIWQIVVLAFLYGIWNTWEFFFTWQFSRLAGLRYCLATHVCWVDLSCKPPIQLPTLRFVKWLAGFYRSIQRSGISYYRSIQMADVEDLFGSPWAAHSSPFVADSMISAASDTLIAGHWDGGRYEGWHAGAPKKPATLEEVNAFRVCLKIGSHQNWWIFFVCISISPTKFYSHFLNCEILRYSYPHLIG